MSSLTSTTSWPAGGWAGGGRGAPRGGAGPPAPGGRGARAERRRDRRAGGAGARGERLPHAALEDARPDRRVAGAAPERHVRAVREQLAALDPGAVALEIELLEAIGHLDRDLRVTHLHELKAELAAVGGERAGAVLAPRGVIALRTQPHLPDVERA